MTDRIKNITDHARVSEKAIEAYLVRRVEELGGICLKYSNMNQTGYPDRIVMLPHTGRAVWVEVKSRGRKPTKVQTLRMEALRAIGQSVYVVDAKEQVDEIMRKEAGHEV